MNSLAPLIAWILVLITFGAAIIFSWQQFRLLRKIAATELDFEDDHGRLRRQAIRRLIGCGLLLAIGAMIAGSFLSGQEDRFDQLGNQIQAQKAAGNGTITPEQEQLKRTYTLYWITVLLLLLGLLVVAGIDLLAVRRHGAKQLRQLQVDRKAMIERELAQYRIDRQRGQSDR